MHTLTLQAPSTPATELLLLFHGVGARAEDLQPLGQWLAPHRPSAAVISVQAPHPSDLGQGWQWFSVRGVTEENRPARVAQAMPEFVQAVRQLQADHRLEAAATTLIGFSQGGIMALESTQIAAPPAGRVVALGARFAAAPRRAPAAGPVHLMHGEADPVMPVAQARLAADQLAALGAVVTCDLFAGLGHGIDGRVAQRILDRLEAA